MSEIIRKFAEDAQKNQSNPLITSKISNIIYLLNTNDKIQLAPENLEFTQTLTTNYTETVQNFEKSEMQTDAMKNAAAYHNLLTTRINGAKQQQEIQAALKVAPTYTPEPVIENELELNQGMSRKRVPEKNAAYVSIFTLLATLIIIGIIACFAVIILK